LEALYMALKYNSGDPLRKNPKSIGDLLGYA
jgi:hypothetical protein